MRILLGSLAMPVTSIAGGWGWGVAASMSKLAISDLEMECHLTETFYPDQLTNLGRKLAEKIAL